jgi:hypothetical protein
MSNDKRFPEESWHEIVSIVASSFSMEEKRKTALLANPVAKLIAAIPYLAGCREPERSALAHVGTYVLGAGDPAKKVFAHKSQDDYDVLARMAAITGFEGGDPVVINRGMKLLAICMIAGYKRDAGTDMGKVYNPVAEKRWNADEKIASLANSVAAAPNPEMDEILTSAKAANVWWDPT